MGGKRVVSIARAEIDLAAWEGRVIYGVGTGIVEVEGIQDLMASGRSRLEAIFTPDEIEYCAAKAREAQHLAARYAAKEAVLRALGRQGAGAPALRDIEVTIEEHGRPRLRMDGPLGEYLEHQNIKGAAISLSHTRKHGIAVIILET